MIVQTTQIKEINRLHRINENNQNTHKIKVKRTNDKTIKAKTKDKYIEYIKKRKIKNT